MASWLASQLHQKYKINFIRRYLDSTTYQLGLIRVNTLIWVLHVEEIFLLLRAWTFLRCTVTFLANDRHLRLEELSIAALGMDKGDLLASNQLLRHKFGLRVLEGLTDESWIQILALSCIIYHLVQLVLNCDQDASNGTLCQSRSHCEPFDFPLDLRHFAFL